MTDKKKSDTQIRINVLTIPLTFTIPHTIIKIDNLTSGILISQIINTYCTDEDKDKNVFKRYIKIISKKTLFRTL